MLRSSSPLLLLPLLLLLLLLSILSSVRGQLVGTYKAENHPSMQWQQCSSGACSNQAGKIVLDANWRWLHEQGTTKNCYSGNRWDSSVCTDNESCAQKCAVDGADYQGTYGIKTEGNALSIKFVTKSGSGANIGSRLYLMQNDTSYQMFNLLNTEFTFDVDMSQVPCGLNAALYFVSMDADGGMSKYPTNKAGAKYGTGYCDSQCPRDLKFINGKANVEGWSASTGDKNAGVGGHGSCCAEMDIWEANYNSAAFTPHPCNGTSQIVCEGDNCGGTYSSTTTRGGGPCDADGCDFNSFRMGEKQFYGKGSGNTIDTSTKFTVVTQFIGSPLQEIKRFYVQNGKVIPNSESKIAGVKGNSITAEYCDAQKKAFGDSHGFQDRGGIAGIGAAMEQGMVLVMSLWDDHYADMMWLDSNYPLDKSPDALGVARGICPRGGSRPEVVESSGANSQVVFSNIKFGGINSTFSAAQ